MNFESKNDYKNCPTCIHRKVCRHRPGECKDYIDENKVRAQEDNA